MSGWIRIRITKEKLESGSDFFISLNYFQVLLARSKFLTNVSPIRIGTTSEHSAYTLTGLASYFILPHDFASSGLAPASDPSISVAVLIQTEKSAPFLIKFALLM